MTARAADTASPPPFISMASKNGRFGRWYAGFSSPRTMSPGLKSANLYGAGADGLQVGRRLARLAALVRFEQVLGDDHAAHAAERVRPERRRPLERDPDGVGVDLLDLDVLVGRDVDGGGGGIGDVLPGEDDSRRRVKGLPSCQETPFFRCQVTDLPSLASPPFCTVGMSAARMGDEVAVGIPRRERLVEDARAILILGAGGEVRVEQGRSLPPESLERAAAASLGGLVGDLGLGLCHARRREHLSRHRRRQSERDHALYEMAAARAVPP